MTQRVKGCTIAFEHDIRDDDVEALVKAIQMLRGVAGVNLSLVTPEDTIHRMRLRSDLREKLYRSVDAAFDPIPTKGQS